MLYSYRITLQQFFHAHCLATWEVISTFSPTFQLPPTKMSLSRELSCSWNRKFERYAVFVGPVFLLFVMSQSHLRTETKPSLECPVVSRTEKNQRPAALFWQNAPHVTTHLATQNFWAKHSCIWCLCASVGHRNWFHVQSANIALPRGFRRLCLKQVWIPGHKTHGQTYFPLSICFQDIYTLCRIPKLSDSLKLEEIIQTRDLPDLENLVAAILAVWPKD